MNNREFHFYLRKLRTPEGRPLTVARIAEAIYVNRSHLTSVLNNAPGHGRQTRPKVKKWLAANYPDHAQALIQALGWTAEAETSNSKLQTSENNQ